MKVLHVIDTLALGGAQTILKSLLELDSNNRDLHAFALRSMPDQTVIAHPNVHVHRSHRRFSFAPLAQLRDYVSAHSIDVLHCHLFRSQVLGFVLRALSFPNIGLIFHEHGRVVGRENEGPFERIAFNAFLRLAAPSVDRFVCISAYTQLSLQKLIPNISKRTVVIHNPLPPNVADATTFSREQARRKLGVPDGAFTIGFAGRLVRRKGWMDFLHAFQATNIRDNAFFLIAGDGPDRALVQQHVSSMALSQRGRLLGQIKAMGEFYRALDCFVIPSLWEPHGLVQLEAQRAGVPVIVSNVPGLRDTVESGVNALLYQAGNPRDLASTLGQVARDSAMRERLVREGFVNAERYSISDFAQSLTTLYDSVAQDGRKARVRVEQDEQ